jgi:TetR/AcrR family transcriptional repressor of bet genes
VSSRKKKAKSVPAPRARNSHGRQRQRLIEACISALHIYGPSRTTVEKVVAIAKMSPGIVRFYFDSKAAMLVASLQFLAAEFEERVNAPVAARKATPVAALEMMVDLYLDPDIASPRKVSVWYAFWGEASSRQEYYDICGQKDEGFASLVRELIERTIAETAQVQLDADGVALGLIGVLEMMWQDFAFRTESTIDRVAAKKRCMAYLRSVFPGSFPAVENGAGAPGAVRFAGWTYDNPKIHALERAQLFHGAWAVVAHESQVPQPGDFVTLDTGTERALVVRDAGGEVRMLRNSCAESPHALIASRSGRFDSVIECKVHGLAFGLDGRGQGQGHAALDSLDSAAAEGLLFARSPHRAGVPETAPPMRIQGGVGLTLLDAPMEIDVAADWKAVVEQWLEFSAPRSELATTEGGLAWTVAAPGKHSWSGRAYDRLVECVAPGEWRREFLAPNQLIETRPDGLSVIQVIPSGPGRCRVRRMDYTALPPEEGARAALYLARRLGPFARRSLLEVAESIQSAITELGYETTAPSRGALAGAAIVWFRRLLAARVPALVSQRPPTGA